MAPLHLRILFLSLVPLSPAGASTPVQEVSVPVHHRRLLAGERCGLIFGSCDDGLTCVSSLLGVGRCLPVTCMVEAIQRYQGVASMEETLAHHIFEKAGVTPEELALSRASDTSSDATFRQESSAMNAVVKAMNAMGNPFPGLAEELAACNSVVRGANSTGETMYTGFHIEGGVLYDGEFSVLTAVTEGEPNLTWIRGCFGGGGAGFDISYLVGVGYTGDREELLGCSALLMDNEIGVLGAVGQTYGVTLDGVQTIDYTFGFGFSVEGLGIGLCGNWAQE